MTEKREKGSFITVCFLVGGTCVGGGMLALPVSTSMIGFGPSLVVMVLAWLFMTATGLLILEVNLWMKKEDSHMVTMASRMLGKGGTSDYMDHLPLCLLCLPHCLYSCRRSFNQHFFQFTIWNFIR